MRKFSFFNRRKTLLSEFLGLLNVKCTNAYADKLYATPTIIFDGYKLPEMFFQQVEKLVFFTDLEIDPK